MAFRVIADHIRTLSFAIADGIQPGNNDRNYVLRRILRRAVRYGRTLGFKEPFFYKLVDVLADTMGDVFPEIRARKKNVQEVIRTEEEAFNKTLDQGIEVFEPDLMFNTLARAVKLMLLIILNMTRSGFICQNLKMLQTNNLIESCLYMKARRREFSTWRLVTETPQILERYINRNVFRGGCAFELYDTYGFPLDLTELMARERGLTVDTAGFEKLMDEQRARARAAQKKEVISLSQIETTTPTKFVGYEKLAVEAKVLEVVGLKDKTAVILDTSACYAEMGGQVGDTGELSSGGQIWRVTNTQKVRQYLAAFLEEGSTRASRAADRAYPQDPAIALGSISNAQARPVRSPFPGMSSLLWTNLAAMPSSVITPSRTFALGVARSREQGSLAERLLCRSGQADLRFQFPATHAAAGR